MLAGVAWQMPLTRTNLCGLSEFSELKELLTPEEYAAARASTLNAHYTSPYRHPCHL